jgi:hypothetical protein
VGEESLSRHFNQPAELRGLVVHAVIELKRVRAEARRAKLVPDLVFKASGCSRDRSGNRRGPSSS